MGKYLDALKKRADYKTPNQAPEFTERSDNSVFSGTTLDVSNNQEGDSSVYSGSYLKHFENYTTDNKTDEQPGDQVEHAGQSVMGKWLERLHQKSKNPEAQNLRPEFTELSASEISETRRQVPEFTEKSNHSVFSGGYLHKMSADEFLAQVTKGLKVGVKELLRLGIITQQDITDLENGMYGPEHVDDYRALIEQQLSLRSVPSTPFKDHSSIKPA